MFLLFTVSYSSRWSGIVPEYYPQFSDGWKYPGHGGNLEDIGLSPPPSHHTQQVFISQWVEWVTCCDGSYTGLITRTLGPSNDFTLLNGWIGRCVRISRLLVGFRMHFKSLHFHSFI